MRILGIDPALTKLGWGIISADSSRLKYIASGIIETRPCDQMPKRLALLVTRLEEIITTYEPIAIAMEETFVNINSVTSLKLGYVRGAVMALIGKCEINFHEFKPNSIKKAITGNGHAEKHQILHMIKLLFPGTSLVKNYDESDAIAIAYTCSVYTRF